MPLPNAIGFRLIPSRRRTKEDIPHKATHLQKGIVDTQAPNLPFFVGPRDATRKREAQRLSQPDAPTAPSHKSGSFQPLAAKRVCAFFLPPNVFQVGTRRVSAAAPELLRYPGAGEPRIVFTSYVPVHWRPAPHPHATFPPMILASKRHCVLPQPRQISRRPLPPLRRAKMHPSPTPIRDSTVGRDPPLLPFRQRRPRGDHSHRGFFLRKSWTFRVLGRTDPLSCNSHRGILSIFPGQYAPASCVLRRSQASFQNCLGALPFVALSLSQFVRLAISRVIESPGIHGRGLRGNTSLVNGGNRRRELNRKGRRRRGLVRQGRGLRYGHRLRGGGRLAAHPNISVIFWQGRGWARLAPRPPSETTPRVCFPSLCLPSGLHPKCP